MFGRGTLHFLRPANESVLAHVREHEGEILLAVHNLAGSAQPVELDLRAWRGYTPIEMLGDTRFPTIGDLPYFISLAPYGYYWFRLQPPLSARSRSMASRPLRSDPGRSWRSSRARAAPTSRSSWRGSGGSRRRPAGSARSAVRDWAILDAEGPLVLLLLDVDGDRYQVPVTVAADAPAGRRARPASTATSVVDAHDDPRFGRRVLAAIAAGRRLDGQAGRVSFHPTPGWSFPPDPDAVPARRHPASRATPR